jgi:hypothetical protein
LTISIDFKALGLELIDVPDVTPDKHIEQRLAQEHGSPRSTHASSIAWFREYSVWFGDFLKLPQGCGSLIPCSHDLIESQTFPASTANGALSNLRVEPRMFRALSL